MTMPQRALVGLIGANIMKSLSPAIHEDAFAAIGVVGHYHLMDVDRLPGRTLPALFTAAKTAGFVGVNVTFPFKQAVIPLLDELTAEARQIGAVNTVSFSPTGRAVGDNTDRCGFRDSVIDALGAKALDGKPVLLLGAGGAGRAVAFALLDLGVRCVEVFDTDTSRATALAVDLIAHSAPDRARAVTNLAAVVKDVVAIINATPIGMLGIPGTPLPLDSITPQHIVCDVIYTPIETALIAAARKRGCRVVTGDGMCVHQAAASFVRFSGQSPDLRRVHQTFRRALAERDAALAAVA
jgi:shikimate dehydrogenase